MTDYSLLLAVLAGVVLLLLLILRLKLHAFISLLICSMAVGFLAGMEPANIIASVEKGMGSTLGFVAIIVGLGAIFGAILEHSGGANAVAGFLIEKFGINKAPTALMLTGFVVAIPVFFDVAFILLVPILYALQKKTGKSLLLFAIPLLAGLAITHAFIPPTPGPIAVANIIGADLGWVIFIGLVTGLPTAVVCGVFFGKYISKKITAKIPEGFSMGDTPAHLPQVSMIFSIIGIPILLILLNTFINSEIIPVHNLTVKLVTAFIGHPFSALVIANLVAWYFLGIKKGISKKALLEMTSKSLAPAGAIILITGAGGAFKQMLIDSGAGTMIAKSLANVGFPVLLFSFVIAALVRIVQGSSTVAMITAASLVAPLIENTPYTGLQLGCLVIAIASGASTTSHVNDSGFWLVNQYLGISEKETFKSWTVMTTLLAFCGLALVSAINYIF